MEGLVKIVRVRAIPMSDPVPPHQQHRTDLGTKVKSDATLILVETDSGLTGIGAALGTPPVIAAIVEYELGPEVVGENPLFSERIFEKMYSGSRATVALERGVAQPEVSRRSGMVMEAISGIDIAVWDVKAQALGIPVYQALGAARSSVRAYASGGWAPGDEAEAELGGYAAKGFSAVKMRVVGRDGFSVDKIVRRVQAARRGIGPNVELMVDAHGSLEVPVAIRVAKALESYDIAWFEEPVSPQNHRGQAEVRRATTIPIASGESEFSRYGFQSLFDHDALDIAQPDVARAGGFTEIRRIAALTSARDIRLAPHAWGSGILFAASIHAAMAAASCHILEVSQGYMPMMWELFNEPFDIRPDGTVQAPDRPGLGFTLRPDALDRFKYVEGPEFS
jgi:L-alanine-DL-glutamate epimerase-like enolase superfamily enzyme